MKNQFNEKKLSRDTLIPHFEKIIDKWLKIRDNGDDDDFWREPSDEDESFPRYVMKMIREINEEMPQPMLNKIKEKEMLAMGHVDYVHKFALYCAELYLLELPNNFN